MTKLGGALPQGDPNGLGSIARKMIDSPETLHLVVAVIDTKSITTNVDSGDVEPTARIRRIEPISGTDREVLVRILRRAYEQRTGRAVLPMDTEDEISAILNGVNPHTGEVDE